MACAHALRPCYTAQFSQQLVSQCRCETSCWRIAQCNMGCLAIFFVAQSVARSRTRFYFSQRIAATGSTINPSSNFSRNFTAVLTRAHAHTSRFSFRGAGYENKLFQGGGSKKKMTLRVSVILMMK